MEQLHASGALTSDCNVADLLHALDTDGSGKVDYLEFLAATLEERITAPGG